MFSVVELGLAAGVWRAGRSLATAIHFLLEAGQQSHWHRVDAIEIWCWHAGGAIDLRRAAAAGPIETIRLGGDILAGDQCQAVIPAGDWQAAAAGDGWLRASAATLGGGNL